MSEFSFTPEGVIDSTGCSEKEFIRDDSDNKLFTEIQIKDIRGLITDDCVAGWDFDGVVYRACANMENRLIRVVHKEDKTITETLPNVTTFKGRGNNISETSWLGLQNIQREVEGLPLFTVDDFEVENLQELKMDKEKAVEQVKIQIFQKIKQVKQQYRIPKVKLLLGGGDNFRMGLDLCRPYKGSRKETLRPLLLKELRQWVLDELDSEYAKPLPDGRLIECDDLSNMYGIKGYNNYRKTGKFNYLEISTDKDSLQSNKLLINPDTYVGENNPLQGKFKFPQAMLIEATDRSVGNVELVVKGGEKSTSKELKGYGTLFLLFQAILGSDQADFYNAIGDLGTGLNCGHVEAYKVLKPCKKAPEALQACLDKMYELLPYGVQYTTHKGEEKDVTTLEYFNEYFKTAYMLRSPSDTMDLIKLCKVMKVDTSKVDNNNLLTPPQLVFNGDNAETCVEGLDTCLKGLLSEIGTYKSLKKGDLVEKLDHIKTIVEQMNGSVDDFYKWERLEK